MEGKTVTEKELDIEAARKWLEETLDKTGTITRWQIARDMAPHLVELLKDFSERWAIAEANHD
mgnify:CR=1 FL=1